MRAYAARQSDGALRAQATALAADIERLLRRSRSPNCSESSARTFDTAPALQASLRSSRDVLHKDSGPGARYLATSGLLADVREALPSLNGGRTATARARLVGRTGSRTFQGRRRAAYGAGQDLARRSTRAARRCGRCNLRDRLINGRERAGYAPFRRLSIDRIELDHYVQELRYLGPCPAGRRSSCGSHSARRWRSSARSSRSPISSSRTSCAAARCCSSPTC